MQAAVDLPRDDEAPASGVRLRPPAPLAIVPPPATHDVLVDVTEEVFFEVLGLTVALSPLQGPWLRLGLGQLGQSLLTLTTWRRRGEKPSKLLRERWPELVPGYSAMDCLARLMVDAIAR